MVYLEKVLVLILLLAGLIIAPQSITVNLQVLIAPTHGRMARLS